MDDNKIGIERSNVFMIIPTRESLLFLNYHIFLVFKKITNVMRICSTLLLVFLDIRHEV